MGAWRAVRTTARGWPSGMVGATPPVRAWRVAIGERAGMVVRKCGPRRMDQRAKAGLGVRVQWDRDAGRCATLALRAWAQLALFQFRLALFACLYLPIFELRCYKQCIPKL
jgi:hypothetical protein